MNKSISLSVIYNNDTITIDYNFYLQCPFSGHLNYLMLMLLSDMNRILQSLPIFILLFFTVFPDHAKAQEVISIAEARELPQGTTVTVAGWVTVTDQFRGPVYFQDETAGIAWYDGTLMRNSDEFLIDVAEGDSIVVTGELGDFNGLLQIVNYDTYTVHPEGNSIQDPVDISTDQLNSGNFEAQLVKISNIEFDDTGVFRRGANYDISDQSGSTELRSDSRSNLPGIQIPRGTGAAVGVGGIFQGTTQLLVRSVADLQFDPPIFPGDDVEKELTFDVVTWNIEWFGDVERAPGDLDLQMNNVLKIIRTIDADLYALQEIADAGSFAALIDSLDGFSGFKADWWQDQKTAYLYRESVIDSLDSGLLTTGQDSYDWASGRFPLFFEFDATVGSETRRIFSYNVHAKAMGDFESYQRRTNASNQFKNYLDTNRSDDNIIFLGDYNDRLIASTHQNQVSPYANFVNDNAYFTISKSLEEAGHVSYLIGGLQSMIDHITVTNELIEDHITNSQRVENMTYIDRYIDTTSDHAPVWTRFDFSRSLVSVEGSDNERPESVKLAQNYPNPFNPATVISYQIPSNGNVELNVYNMLGQRVATLVNEQMPAGSHEVVFDASGLSSGIYFYRLTAGNTQLTRKMTLVK